MSIKKSLFLSIFASVLLFVASALQAQQTERWIVEPKYKKLGKYYDRLKHPPVPYTSITLLECEANYLVARDSLSHDVIINVAEGKEIFTNEREGTQQLKILSTKGAGVVYGRISEIWQGERTVKEKYYTLAGEELEGGVNCHSAFLPRKMPFIVNSYMGKSRASFISENGQLKTYYNTRLIEAGHERIIIEEYKYKKNKRSKPKVGIIDWEGNEITSNRYNNIEPFVSTSIYTLFEQKGKHGIIDIYGKIIVPAKYEKTNFDERLILKKKNQFFLLNNKGTLVRLPNMDYEKIYVVNEETDFFWRTEVNGQTNYINQEGEFIIPEKYKVASRVYQDKPTNKVFFLVQDEDNNTGIIDQDANVIFSFKTQIILPSLVSMVSKEWLKKKQKKMQAQARAAKEPIEYDYIWTVYGNPHCVYKDYDNKKFGLLLNYQTKTEAIWDTIISFYITDKLLAKKGRNWHLISPTKETPTIISVSNAHLLFYERSMANGLAIFQQKGKKAIMDIVSEEVVTQHPIKNIHEWHNRLLKVVIGEETHIMNTSGQLLANFNDIPQDELIKIGQKIDGEMKWFIKLPKDNIYSYIDLNTGKIVFQIPSKYELRQIYNLEEKIFIVKNENGLCGLLQLE